VKIGRVASKRDMPAENIFRIKTMLCSDLVVERAKRTKTPFRAKRLQEETGTDMTDWTGVREIQEALIQNIGTLLAIVIIRLRLRNLKSSLHLREITSRYQQISQRMSLPDL
jgi:hypothetical protein